MKQDLLEAFWAQVKADPELAAQEIEARTEGRVVYLTGTCRSWDRWCASVTSLAACPK